jgi:hypothetical protein
MISNWLTPELKRQIKTVFDPRYKRKLRDEEVEDIAENLTGLMEIILKHKYKAQFAVTKSTK